MAVTTLSLVRSSRSKGFSGQNAINQAKFAELADGAKDGCPVSHALKGNVELSVVATLA